MARNARAAAVASGEAAEADALRRRIDQAVAEKRPLTVREAKFLKSGEVPKHVTVGMHYEGWRRLKQVCLDHGLTMQSFWDRGVNAVLKELGEKPIAPYGSERAE